MFDFTFNLDSGGHRAASLEDVDGDFGPGLEVGCVVVLHFEAVVALRTGDVDGD